MKKLGFLLMLFVFLLTVPKPVAADAANAHIFLDGEPLSLTSDVQVVNQKGTVMIPIRIVSENLGFNVKWNKAEQSVTVENADTLVKMTLNQHQAEINGAVVELAIPPMLDKQTTYVPLRFVSEQMGLDVKWDNQAKAVYLISPDTGAETVPVSDAGTGTAQPPAGGSQAGVTLTGMTFADNRLMLETEGKIAPSVFRMNAPERIVIDLPQTNFSERFMAEHGFSDSKRSGELIVTDNPDVAKVRYAMFSDNPSTLRIVIDLTTAKNYTVINDDSGFIIIDLNAAEDSGGTLPALPPVGDGKKTVVIDPGHGGTDPGVTSVSGVKESDFNLAVALKVSALLEEEKDIHLVMSRSDDSYPTLKERAQLANNVKADIFVSIHGNGSTASSANGTETLYTRDESKLLASVMHKHLMQATGLRDRGVKYQNILVTRETKMPAVLLEIGFMTNQGDEAQLLREDFQNRVAQGIVEGIKEYLGIR